MSVGKQQRKKGAHERMIENENESEGEWAEANRRPALEKKRMRKGERFGRTMNCIAS